MRLIDADALIAKLLYDVALNEKILDDTDFAESDRELFQFDKDCKQNAINWLQATPTIEIRSNCSKTSSWTPCSERLPKKEKRSYWICLDGGGQCQCRWTNDMYGLGAKEHSKWGWHIMDKPQYSKVVAWMPLPKPYKGDF